MGYYALQLFPTDHQWPDGNYLMRHYWTCLESGAGWATAPSPPLVKVNDNSFKVVLNVGTLEGQPKLYLTNNPPVAVTDLAGSQTNPEQIEYGGADGFWSLTIEGPFTFNALIKATVKGEPRTYKADPEMVVSSDGSGNVLPIG